MTRRLLARPRPWLAATAGAAPKEIKDKKPKVEVVFCLDTTGSMGGLIEGAKQKIWAICNQIVGRQADPEPQGRPASPTATGATPTSPR